MPAPALGAAVRVVVADEPFEACVDEVAETHLDVLADDVLVPRRCVATV